MNNKHNWDKKKRAENELKKKDFDLVNILKLKIKIAIFKSFYFFAYWLIKMAPKPLYFIFFLIPFTLKYLIKQTN